MQTNKSSEVLAKQINIDLSILSYWLKAKKLYFNVQKTELIIFRPAKLKIKPSFKFKLDGKNLAPSHTVKYLGVLLDEHLHWNKQLNQVKMKLNRAIRILSKLRYKPNLELTLIV